MNRTFSMREVGFIVLMAVIIGVVMGGGIADDSKELRSLEAKIEEQKQEILSLDSKLQVSKEAKQNSENVEIKNKVYGVNEVVEDGKCMDISNTTCFTYINSDGYTSYFSAKESCEEKGFHLPSKTDISENFDSLLKKFEYTQIGFVWTKERKTIYGWVEPVTPDYKSNWASADSDKRGYVGYVCVR